MTWVLDLDGVVWRGGEPIAGSVEAICRLQDAGIRVTYVTNNSVLGAAEQVQKLSGMGIDCTPDDVLSARDLLVDRVGTGARVLAACAPPLTAALQAAGNEVFDVRSFVRADGQGVDDPPLVDCVVVGQRFDTTYNDLSVATRGLLQCRRLLAPNTDPLYPHSSGMLVGTGSLVALLERSANVHAEIVGKPEPIMVQALKSVFPDAALVVGDQLETDGELANRAGVPFAFVESGVGAERPSGESTVAIAHTATDLARLVDALL